MKELIEQYKNLQDDCDTIINEIIPTLPNPNEFDFHFSYRQLGNLIEVILPLNLDTYRAFRKALGQPWRANSGSLDRHCFAYRSQVRQRRVYLSNDKNRDQGNCCL